MLIITCLLVATYNENKKQEDEKNFNSYLSNLILGYPLLND